MNPQDQKYLPTDLPEEIPAHTGEPHSHKTQQNDHNDSRALLSWSAPGRPYKKRGRQFFVTALLIATLIEVILFLFGQYLFMLVVASLVFVGFAFAITPPKNFHYRISSQGVRVEDRFYIWDELYDFYFRTREGEDILFVRTLAIYPGALVISLGDISKEQVKNALIPYLPYREYVKPTFVDKSADWLVKNFPLEKNS
jgi:hypothetical protein